MIKTIMKWHILLVSIVIAMSVVSSCEKSKKVEPPTPIIIDSKIISYGKESLKTTNSKEGTTLSYKSWLMVRSETKATSETKVEVELNNVVHNLNTEFVVKSFEVGNYTTSTYRKTRSSERNGYITTTPNVLVYKVAFAEFAFEYEIDFDVAVYDDGFSKQEFPYYEIGKITDKGISAIESIESTDNGTRWFRNKLLSHSIAVEINGKEYVAIAKVTLRQDAGAAGEDYLVSEQFIESVFVPLDETVIWAVRVLQKFSKSGTKSKSFYYTAELSAWYRLHQYVNVYNFKNDIKVVSRGFGEETLRTVKPVDSFIDSVYTVPYNISYNYGISKVVTVQYSSMTYDDGYLRIKAPKLEMQVSLDPLETIFKGTYSDNLGGYQEYELNQNLKIKYSDGESFLEEMTDILLRVRN